LVARDAADLKAAVQCDAMPVLNKSVRVSANEAESAERVGVTFVLDDINHFTGNTEYFFLGVYCTA
jgi:hypothetical protein